MASWWGTCKRCRHRRDLGYIPGTHWLVCLQCYIEWFNLPADHPAKMSARGETS